MDIKELIPKHKDDQKVIAGLKKLSFEQMKPIVPKLLEWLQDMNWPIAGPIAEVLKPFENRITAEIIKILKTDDGVFRKAGAWLFPADESRLARALGTSYR